MSKRLETVSVSRILVAVDGSEHSKKAIELAVDIANKWNAEMKIIHVMEEREIPDGFKEYAKSERIPVSSYFDMACGTYVGDAEKRVKNAGIKKVEVLCEHGNPADEIIKAAKNMQADLIIMGSRGLGRFSRAIMGSVSTKVCNHSHCTCITVK